MRLVIIGDDLKIKALERELWFRARKCGFAMEVFDDNLLSDDNEDENAQESELNQDENTELDTEKPKITFQKKSNAPIKKAGRPIKKK